MERSFHRSFLRSGALPRPILSPAAPPLPWRAPASRSSPLTWPPPPSPGGHPCLAQGAGLLRRGRAGLALAARCHLRRPARRRRHLELVHDVSPPPGGAGRPGRPRERGRVVRQLCPRGDLNTGWRGSGRSAPVRRRPAPSMTTAVTAARPPRGRRCYAPSPSGRAAGASVGVVRRRSVAGRPGLVEAWGLPGASTTVARPAAWHLDLLCSCWPPPWSGSPARRSSRRAQRAVRTKKMKLMKALRSLNRSGTRSGGVSGS